MLSTETKKNHFPGFSQRNCPVTLLPNEEASILKEAEERCYRDHVMIKLALFTGLRNSEVIGLNIITVSPYGSVSSILDLPGTIAKGGFPRQIPLREDLVLLLNTFIESKSLRNEPSEPDSPLFVTKKTKKRIGCRDFQRILHDISTKVLNRSIYPHVLRHTFATNLLARSNIRIVQQAHGHSSIQSTMIYTHPSLSDLATAINKI